MPLPRKAVVTNLKLRPASPNYWNEQVLSTCAIVSECYHHYISEAKASYFNQTYGTKLLKIQGIVKRGKD
jgi:hypothetical protein